MRETAGIGDDAGDGGPHRITQTLHGRHGGGSDGAFGSWRRGDDHAGDERPGNPKAAALQDRTG